MKGNDQLSYDAINSDAQSLKDNLESDKTFLSDDLSKARQHYKAKFSKSSTAVEVLKNISWEVVEFVKLNEHCQGFLSKVQEVKQSIAANEIVAAKLKLRRLFVEYLAYLTNLFKKKRQPPASHVMVIMLSDERRKNKPYALPVKYFPYHSLCDQQLCGYCTVMDTIKMC